MKKILLLALFALTAITVQAQVLDDTAKNLNFTGRLNTAKGVAINSAALVDLNSVAGNLVHVVGNTTITSFGIPSQAGIHRTVIFDGTLTLTYDSATLALPGNASIVTAAGDAAIVVSDSLTKWVVINYTRRASVQ